MGPCKVTRKESQAQGHGRSLSIVVTFIGVKEMLHPWGCRGWAGSISNCPDVLANPPVYLGTSWLSFKLSNTFPGVLQECTRPSPYPVSFLDLLGFGALILSKHFHGFSQSRVLPFIVTCCTWLQVLLCHLHSVCALSRRTSPLHHHGFYAYA